MLRRSCGVGASGFGTARDGALRSVVTSPASLLPPATIGVAPTSSSDPSRRCGVCTTSEYAIPLAGLTQKSRRRRDRGAERGQHVVDDVLLREVRAARSRSSDRCAYSGCVRAMNHLLHPDVRGPADRGDAASEVAGDVVIMRIGANHLHASRWARRGRSSRIWATMLAAPEGELRAGGKRSRQVAAQPLDVLPRRRPVVREH